MKDRQLFRQLRAYLNLTGNRSWKWIVAAIAGSLLLAIMDTLGVAAMIPLMNLLNGADTSEGFLGAVSRTLDTDDPSILILAVASMAALAFICKSAASIPFRWWLVGRTTRLSANAATEMLRRYVLAPFAEHRRRNLPEIYRNVNDATAQSSSVLLALMSTISDILVVAAILAVLFIAAPAITIVAVLFFSVVIGAIQGLLKRHQVKVGEQLAATSLSGWRFMMPVLDGFREARLTSSANVFIAGYHSARLNAAGAQRKLTLISEVPRYLLEIAFVVAIAGIAVFQMQFAEGGAALATVGLFAVAALRALPTLNRISASLASIRSGQVGMGILYDAIEDLADAEQHEELPRAGERLSGDIVLSNVSFRFADSDEYVVNDLSVVVAGNQTTAFVGASGAGKSTVLDLVLGLLHPTAGEIRCGGRRIDDDAAAWFSTVGVVSQDVFLLNNTVTANVAFGVPPEHVDLERVHRALRLAELTTVIDALPEGLETTLGERGVRLSGGQRQRIGLARALYREPTVLVLDEATSALDNETEHEIALTIHNLGRHMTVIIVAHRLSTVKDADKLVFMEGGRKAGEGKFEDLRQQVPEFERLVALGELR